MKKVLIILGFIFLNFACSQEDLIEKGENAYKNKDYTNAIKYFQQACDLNNGNGCNELGTMYTLVKKNNFKAMESYQKACDLNYKQG
ncbi:tetratricopeptide repeat protein, partial [Campylobacter coli]